MISVSETVSSSGATDDVVAANSNQCFGCGKGLEHIAHFPNHQCQGATIFHANGNYGSTAWDPLLSGQALVINICDQCLNDRSHLVQLRTHVQRIPEYEYAPWEPGSDE